MNILDDPKRVKHLDPNNALGSVGMLADQFEQVFKEFKKIKIPKQFKAINTVVHNGMGGSALGAHMIQSIYSDELKKPFQVISSYKVPASVDKNTLYIICSYSGTTAEPISTYQAAKKTGAKIFAITSGGKLGSMIKAGKMPGYIFDPKANPSNQPRIGVGYTIAAELALFKKLSLIKLSDAQIKDILVRLAKLNNLFGFDNPAVKNPAKQMAEKIKEHSVAIVASEHLMGNAHVFANQTNETGKTLSAYYFISELNHHLMEGLKFPSVNRLNLLFIFLESKLYHPKNQLRYKITKDVLTKNKISYVSYQAVAKDKLNQAMEVIAFSSYVTFYLAMLNNVNPNKIPFVDYFKTQLTKLG